MTSLKNDMKRILSVTFPELETITGIFTKSTLRLLTEFPSAHAIRKAGYDAVADDRHLPLERKKIRPLRSRPSWMPPPHRWVSRARQRT